jgi:hypothetical protein
MRRGAARALFLAAPLLLGGCAAFVLPSSKNYIPVWARLNNQAQYNADLQECHSAIDGLSSLPDIGAVASGTVNGATNNGAVAVINPLVIVGGAGAGLVGGIVGGYDLTGEKSITSLVLCMDRLTSLDGSAVMADYHG